MRMQDNTVKHRNIPIFIPHLGCPNMCVFCNQRSISGKQIFRKESVVREIDEALETIPSDCDVEIAYFGGSFTGIDRDLMIYLLEVAKGYVDRQRPGKAKISGIRMSTRPDYITEEIIRVLSCYPVKTVELGLQSMDDDVLKASKRGHDAKTAKRACEMVKKAGYELIGQMMIGLPGSTLEKELMTAEKICEMGADGVRIYPTVTFYDTELAEMAERGEYKMLGIDDAVFRSKEVLKVFNANGVECIRLGLCSSDNLGDADKVKGGANHPALGELVQGELVYDQLREMLMCLAEKESLEGKSFSVSVYKGELSRAIGQNGRNRERLVREFKLKNLKFNETIHAIGITLSLIE